MEAERLEAVVVAERLEAVVVAAVVEAAERLEAVVAAVPARTSALYRCTPPESWPVQTLARRATGGA